MDRNALAATLDEMSLQQNPSGALKPYLPVVLCPNDFADVSFPAGQSGERLESRD